MEKFPQLLNQKDSHGYTAMHYACKCNKTEVVKLLLSHDKCQIVVYNDKQKNPLHYASKRRNLEVMKILLDLHISLLNIKNNKGQTPLHLTLSHGDKFAFFTLTEIDKNDMIEASKYLLSLNCSVNVKNQDEKTPLHLASMHFNVEIIKLLLERDGTMLNQQDKNGRTPLHYVFYIYVGESYGTTRYETVSCLLNFPECDINLTDNKGNTPLHLAASHKECKANTQDIDGDTPLHSCIQSWIKNEQTMYIMIKLIKNDTSILNIKNNKGQTPLHEAVKVHSFKDVDLLVRLGADVHMIDNDNRTPLELARWLAADRKNNYNCNTTKLEGKD
ncbi:hypothetical protein B566_EDAN013995, partial [Ephemera danica]